MHNHRVARDHLEAAAHSMPGVRSGSPFQCDRAFRRPQSRAVTLLKAFRDLAALAALVGVLAMLFSMVAG